MKPVAKLLSILVVAVLAAACTSEGGGSDPYADPGTPPPDPITDPTVATSGSIGPSDEGGDLMEINVAGFTEPETGSLSVAQLAELPASAFTVVEAGTVKGITVERIGGEVRAAADVVFVFDTTFSMGSGLDSVQDSIIAFADHLDGAGLDVRLGAVTFGDAFDTVADVDTPVRGTSLEDRTPPTFDGNVRPTLPLTDDYDAFQTFVTDDSPRGGGDNPENAIGALDFAATDLDWRAGAQKTLIVVTDVCSHTDTTFESEFSSYAGWEGWAPPATDDLLSDLSGNSTVHVVGPRGASPAART
ncbi:MAG: vWA domain-containing protein [Trueperaceae bacterium]|nr:vWA domain-containing protein [Trueperaceae bacterium]